MKKNITNQNAETGTPTLRNVVEDAYSLNDKMEQAIIKIVRENGGLVRTYDTKHKIPIYAYVFNEESMKYEEQKILAINVSEDKYLSILIGPEYVTLDDMTNDEVVECSDWYDMNDGIIFATPTLACICEFLDDYID